MELGVYEYSPYALEQHMVYVTFGNCGTGGFGSKRIRFRTGKI